MTATRLRNLIEQIERCFVPAGSKSWCRACRNSANSRLAHGLHATLKSSAATHLVEKAPAADSVRYQRCGSMSLSTSIPAEVLHELAGQFDGVPLDTVDSRHAEQTRHGSTMCRPWPNCGTA